MRILEWKSKWKWWCVAKWERVAREILCGVLEEKKLFSQAGIARACGVSLGLVNKTVRRFEETGGVQVVPRGLRVVDANKVLLQWAAWASRKAKWRGYRVRKSAEEIEASLPSGVVFTAFSGWRLLSGSTPADYGQVHVYVDEENAERGGGAELFEAWLEENKPAKGLENLFVAPADRHLLSKSKRGVAPVPQIFVDLYSSPDLSAKYFLKDVLKKHPQLGFEE